MTEPTQLDVKEHLEYKLGTNTHPKLISLYFEAYYNEKAMGEQHTLFQQILSHNYLDHYHKYSRDSVKHLCFEITWCLQQTNPTKRLQLADVEWDEMQKEKANV